MNYPIFRRYKNGKSFFRIDSNDKLTEVKLIGKKYQVYVLSAKTYYDRLLIDDLKNLSSPEMEEVSELAFTSFLEHCRENYKLLG